MTKEEAIQRLVDLQDGSGQTYEAIRMAIEALSAEAEWIPCTERLPQVGRSVLLSDGYWTEEGYMMRNGDWINFRGSTHYRKEQIVAWQPLPKSYGKENEEWLMEF